MEGMDYYEHNEMTERSDIIIGFYPSDDLSKLMELSEQLKAFLASEAFAKFTFNPPSFHAGVEWYPREEDDEDNEYEESEDEEDIIPSIPAKPPAKTTAKSLSAEELHAMFYSS
jgi:hypothetical protein